MYGGLSGWKLERYARQLPARAWIAGRLESRKSEVQSICLGGTGFSEGIPVHQRKVLAGSGSHFEPDESGGNEHARGRSVTLLRSEEHTSELQSHSFISY